MTAWTTMACACLLQAVGAAGADVPAALAGAEVRAVERTSDGALWFGVRGRGLARLDTDGLRWIGSADGVLPGGIADLHEVSGSLWVAGPGGVGRLGPEGWTGSSEVGGLEPRVVFGVSPGSEPDEVWFATSAGAVRRGGPGSLTLTTGDGLPHDVVHDVVVGLDGSVWILCRTGLARWKDGVMETFRTDLNFRAGLIGPDGQPWFGTSDGVLRWNGRGWDQELRGITVYPALVASDGSVWAGSASAGLFRYRSGRWTEVALDGQNGVEVFDVAEARNGSIWVATATGVVRLPADI